MATMMSRKRPTYSGLKRPGFSRLRSSTPTTATVVLPGLPVREGVTLESCRCLARRWRWLESAGQRRSWWPSCACSAATRSPLLRSAPRSSISSRAPCANITQRLWRPFYYRYGYQKRLVATSHAELAHRPRRADSCRFSTYYKVQWFDATKIISNTLKFVVSRC